MGILVSMESCPFCLNGNNTPCFARYSDGFKCFSCGKVKKYGKDSVLYNKEASEVNVSDITLPETISRISEFSTTVMSWLYSYHVYEEDIKKFNIKYVPHQSFKTKTGVEFDGEGLILPVIKEGVIVFYQWRFFPNKQFITKGSKETVFTPGKESDTIVIVEDYISAIRVSKHTQALCMFGTHLNENALDYIAGHRKNVIIWLDNDFAGVEGAEKTKNRLVRRYTKDYQNHAWLIPPPVNIHALHTVKQPKEYSGSEIKSILGEIINEF